MARCAHGPGLQLGVDISREGVGWCRVNVAAAVARVAPRRLAMLRSRRMWGCRSGAPRRRQAAVMRAATGISRRQARRRPRRGLAAAHAAAVAAGKTLRGPGDGLLGLHVFAPGARQVLRRRLPPLLRPGQRPRPGRKDLAAGVAPRAAARLASAAVLFWSGGKDSFLALRKPSPAESDPEIMFADDIRRQ